MKILGICGSPRKENVSSCYRLTKTILEATGCDYDLVSLRGMNITGCIACLGCVNDNVCKVIDDMSPLRDKIVKADAYVIGAPNYYSGLNAITHAFLERLFQFRHQEGNLLWGKLAVTVGVGGSSGGVVTGQIEQFMAYNFIETMAKVSGQGAASCYSCGYGETCKVGAPYMLHGDGVKITKEMIPDISKQPNVLDSGRKAGEQLGERLRIGHDRQEVTAKMQQLMLEKFKSST